MNLQRPSSQHANAVRPKTSGSSSTAKPPIDWEPRSDQEIITGPVLQDDPLSAPPPTIRQGKGSDFPIRKQRESTMPAFATSPQAKSPPHSRAMSPQIRNGNAFTAQQHRANSSHVNSVAGPSNSALDRSASTASSNTATQSMVSALSNQPSTRNVSPFPTLDRAVSPQSSYHASTNGSSHPIANPRPDASRQPSYQGISSAAAASQRGESSNGAQPKPSQYTANTMASDARAAYGYTERDPRHRQGVTPDELVARGLDEGVFAGLR